MRITKANLDNSDEIKGIIILINKVFLECNIKHSTEGLIKIMNSLYGTGCDYEYTLADFKKSTLFFIAKEHDHIIGIIRWTKNRILNLYIAKDYQKQWVGQKLLKKFETVAKKEWSSVIRLKSSKYALPFYLKHGYLIKKPLYLEKNI